MARRDSDVLSALLDRALSLPPEGRAAFLANECRNDQSLREEISSLLAAHDASCVFFERLSEEIVNPALLALSDHVGHELVVGQMLAQYRILERLAAGGMGVVFKALDQRLDRFVALKFLPAPLSGDPRAKERLVAEAKAASALDHPNIAVVHDIGETDRGLLFIVMAYYEGETLERKNERGPLPARDALDVVKQIAHALSAAHRKGIVHRDVKPSNVLVTKEGTAKLLDFGIAKLTAVTPTREAAVPGTVAYMSPEQTRGSAIDRRTDLWSLGVMLYEMLIGVRPFRAENDEALVRAIRHDEWQLLDSMTGALPAGIVRVLERCLAKDPDRRYRDAPELLADLRMLEAQQSSESNRAADGTGRARLLRYGGIAALVSVVTAGAFHFERPFDDAESPLRTAEFPSHRNRLAILPLVHVSTDPEAGDLVDGMAEGLITQLSRIGELRIIARASVVGYKDSGKNAHEIGRELGAGALLSGNVRLTSGQMQITLHLVDAKSQEAFWTRHYAAAIADSQRIQRQIVLHVAEALGVQRQGSEVLPPSQAGTTSAEAYLLYLKGRRFLEKRNEEGVKQAKEHFEHALDLDPAFARAWVALGETFSVLSALATVRTADAYTRSRAAAERALQIDPDLPEAHVCLATALSLYYWDFKSAADHYRRALELNPSYADAHRLYAEHLRYQGRFDEALQEARAAEDLDPLSSAPQILAGTILYLARQYDPAIGEFRRILQVNPRFSYAYFFLALAHIQKHEYHEALEALSVAGAGSNLQRDMLTGYIDAVAGRQAEARKVVERLQLLSRTQKISPWHPAIIHVGLGEHDQAIDLLEQAYRSRDWQVRMLPVEPLLDPLRSHPRFRTLTDKMRTHAR